jgi:hypothetical protein
MLGSFLAKTKKSTTVLYFKISYNVIVLSFLVCVGFGRFTSFIIKNSEVIS